jgi:hypothetical protein
MNGMIWCSTPHATVGLIVGDSVVTACPPYARRWALGRPAAEVWQDAQRHGAILRWLPDPRGRP